MRYATWNYRLPQSKVATQSFRAEMEESKERLNADSDGSGASIVEESSADTLTLKVVLGKSKEATVTIARRMPFAKVAEMLTDKLGGQRIAYFLFDGERVGGSETALSVELEELDQVDAVFA